MSINKMRYELSNVQKRFWISEAMTYSQSQSEKSRNNLSSSFYIYGNLNIECFRKSIQKIVDRHSILRTYFEEIDGVPYQIVLESFELHLDVHKEYDKNTFDPNQIMMEEAQSQIELEKVPLFRIKLFQVNNELYFCTIIMHHIISDGWSVDIFTKELLDFYFCYSKGNPIKATDLNIQYCDYSHWQNELVESEEYKEKCSYWLKTLSGKLPELNFPLDYKRPEIQLFDGNSVPLNIDKGLFQKLKKICIKNQISMYTLLLTAMCTLLYRYTGDNDIIVGSSTSGRIHPELKNMMGCFINTLPLRIKNIDGNQKFIDMLLEVKKVVEELYKNQEYPFDKIVENLKTEKKLNRNVIFDVLFEYNNWAVDQKDDITLEKGTIHFKRYEHKITNSMFDFSFELFQRDNSVNGFIQYCTNLFQKETMEFLSDNYLNLLKHIAIDITVSLDEINLIGNKEKEILLTDFHKNKKKFPIDKNYMELLSRQIHKNYDKTAVICEEKIWTYGMLGESIQQMAQAFIQWGAVKSEFVAIMGNGSYECLVGMLSAFQAGCAYVPIDPGTPYERIKFIIENCKARILLVHSDHILLFERFGYPDSVKHIIYFGKKHLNLTSSEKITIQNYKELQVLHIDKEEMPKLHSNSVAYMIYTSGSTGNPKGVLVRHDGMINHIYSKINDFSIGETDKVLQNASISFDISVWQFLTALLVGGTTVIMPPDYKIDQELFIKYIKQHKLTIVEMVPTLLSAFLDVMSRKSWQDQRISNLRWMIVTGEELPFKIVKQWFERYAKIGIANVYGPTEASDDITHKIFDREKDIALNRSPIGKPINNLTIYIVNPIGKLVPVGVRGEIWVSGIGVGNGYWNNIEKTEKSFIKDPFSDGQQMLYRTGDIGRWLWNGDIEFFGRLDNQVKIRGYRIELEEIENCILVMSDVHQTVVSVKKDKNDENYLVAYLTVNQETFSQKSLQSFMSKKLPHYMIPSYFIILDEMPLLSSGKINRKELNNVDVPLEVISIPVKKDSEPYTDTEKKVAGVWKDVLKIEYFDKEDNFFQIGGHSITAVKVASRLSQLFEMEIQLQEIFNFQTLSDISAHINEKLIINKNKVYQANPLVKLGEEEFYHLAPVQKPEWYLHQLEPENSFYNISLEFLFYGEFNYEAFFYAWDFLIMRHQVLRLYFTYHNGIPVQKIRKELNLEKYYKYIDCMDVPEDDFMNIVKKLSYEHANKIFDFLNGPLFSIQLAQFNKNRVLFMFSTHHIIWDETSTMIMVKELNELYNAYCEKREPVLNDQKIDYVDYTRWINRSIDDNLLQKQKGYWLEIFKNVPPLLNIPTDYKRLSMQTFKGDTLFNEFDAEETAKIHKFCQNKGVTLYMFFLAVLNLQLYKLTGQKEFVVGSPIFNRDEPEIENIIGLFASALLLKAEISDFMTFESLLEKTKETAISAYENHIYPSNYVIEEIEAEIDLSRSKLFTVMYGLQNNKNDIINKINFYNLETRYKFLEFIENNSRFEITLAIDEIGDIIELNYNYNIDLFKRTTAQRMLKQFYLLTIEVINNPKLQINSYRMMTQEHFYKITEQFNHFNSNISTTGCIHDKIEEQAKKRPDNVALIFHHFHMTYKELMERTNQLSNHLIENGVAPDEHVGIMFKNSLEMIIGILSVLKAGAVYVPILPDYPQVRKNNIVNDANIRYIITESIYPETSSVQKIYLDTDKEKIERCSKFSPGIKRQPDDLAYIIFTSGTTGIPKGIMIEHLGIVSLLEWYQKEYCLKEGDSTMLITPFTFDVSVVDIMWPLMSGASVFIPDEEDKKNPAIIRRLTAENNITVLQFVPGQLKLFLDAKVEREDLSSLKYVICGGEALPRSLKDAFYQQMNCKLMNHYGPTEITVDALKYDCSQEFIGDIVPIGKPIDGTKAYILDEYYNPVDIGILGEIYISSIGMARGYLNDDEMNKKCFIENKMCPGEILYKTGDIGKYLEDGNILYVGRKDEQVKIRGNRVELREIESIIDTIDNVDKSAVLYDKFNTEKLLAFIQLKSAINTYIDRGQNQYRLYTYSQVPYLKNKIDALHALAWPDFFVADEIMTKYWKKLYEIYPDYQLVLLTPTGDVATICNLAPYKWNGKIDNLPKGWDGALQKVFKNVTLESERNTLVAFAAVVGDDYKNKGLSSLILSIMKDFAGAMKYESITIPVRPVSMPDRTGIDFENWVLEKREDESYKDNWLRTHIKVGGEILKIEKQSQFVKASVDMWAQWANIDFKQTGEYRVKGAIQDVNIDIEENCGIYYDPCVWVLHKTDKVVSKFQYVKIDEIGKVLKNTLPDYMIPNQYFILDKLPINNNQKIDKNKIVPEKYINNIVQPIVTPRNELDRKILKIWEDIFEKSIDNIQLDFFELGGHSLKATVLAIRLEDEFQIKIPLKQIMLNRTIQSFSDYIDALLKGSEAPVQSNQHNEVMDADAIISYNDETVYLRGIEPFCDIYYINCFYNSFFPVISYFNKSMLQILHNDTISYALNLDEEVPILKIDYIPDMEIETLLKCMGIDAVMKTHSSTLIDDIEHAINLKRPVIIWVDCFYEPLRTEMYQQKHFKHSWLIYGYNREKKVLNIVEHKKYDSMLYKKMEISYTDAINCYEGYNNSYNRDQTSYTYFEFYNTEVNNESFIKHTSIISQKVHKQHILKGLELLKYWIYEYEQLVLNSEQLEKYKDSLLDGINQVINGKKVDIYRTSKQENSIKILSIMEDILHKWNLIRKNLILYNYCNKYSCEDFKYTIVLLNEIYEKELEYNHLF